ncbi:hypothetical protein GcM3_00943 [Golovinomyces cichoracearum]|uniref:Uncharacterized protein n=1 Tax=Golovinomyces cichoracearum TaxID=62708 RepID=A0A420I374_9PEZI|nr:hypothetical protein GcM3_00943 [Golovinomyces cichoracearum]
MQVVLLLFQSKMCFWQDTLDFLERHFRVLCFLGSSRLFQKKFDTKKSSGDALMDLRRLHAFNFSLR